MALRLKLVSHHKNVLAERSVKEFGREGGTIGRSLQSDWVLPDTQRYVSSRHASIDFRSGSFYIVDTSTNGVYVNGAERPVGRGKPQRLFNGDRIRIGEFEMVAEIDDESAEHAMIDEFHVDPVDLAQRVEAPEPTGEDLVDAFEITGVGIEMELSDDELESLVPPSKRGDYFVLELEDDTDPEGMAMTKPHVGKGPAEPKRSAAPPQPLAAKAAVRRGAGAESSRRDAPSFAPAASPAAVHTNPPAAARPSAAAAPGPGAEASGIRAAVRSPAAPAAAPQRKPGADAAPAQASRSTPAPQPAAAPSRDGDPPPSASVTSVTAGKASQALEPFFRGAGIKPQRVDAQQADAMLLCLGQLMREMIVGVSEILHQRAQQKNALRLPNTTIQPRDNNPLKFSASVEEALLNLLMRDSQEYLPPVDAVRDAFADIKHHQLVLLKALRGAVDGYIGRLDPDDLEHKFSRGKSGMLANAANKLKFWDLYKDLYQLVASHPPGELPMQFLEDFAHAYEQETQRAALDGAETAAAKAS